MRHFVVIAVTLGLALQPGTAAAETSTKNAVDTFDKGDVRAVAYLAGAAKGIAAGNAIAQHTFGKRFYCPPAGFELAPDKVVQILKDIMKRDGFYADLPAEVVLMVELARLYPCP